jgi:hypothetical protein
LRTSDSLNFPCCLIASKRSPPWIYCNTRHKCFSSLKISINFMMFGWSNCFNISISVSTEMLSSSLNSFFL